MSTNSAIIIPGYNRPIALKRLLSSIDKADFHSKEIDLIISLDKSDTDECQQVAAEFDWKFGAKRIIAHPENLGLKKHIIACGDLSENYDWIIILEDDLYVSRQFYNFTAKAIDFYKEDPKISGVSLYNYQYNETACKHFTPQDNGSDVYFLQLPSSWGQAWTKKQWNDFKAWLNSSNIEEVEKKNLIPQNVIGWPESSWKKLFIYYMVDKGLYFVYPTVSHTTNFMDEGTHHKEVATFLQVPLQNTKKHFSFLPLDSSPFVYDSFCEINPDYFSTVDALKNFKYEVDLYGTKPLNKIGTDYILTTRFSTNPHYTFDLRLKPHELNVLDNINGKGINFCRISTVINEKFEINGLKRSSYYYNAPEFTFKFFSNIYAEDVNQGLSDEIQRMRNSRSWRVTVPLREGKNVLKKSKNFIKKFL